MLLARMYSMSSSLCIWEKTERKKKTLREKTWKRRNRSITATADLLLHREQIT